MDIELFINGEISLSKEWEKIYQENFVSLGMTIEDFHKYKVGQMLMSEALDPKRSKLVVDGVEMTDEEMEKVEEFVRDLRVETE